MTKFDQCIIAPASWFVPAEVEKGSVKNIQGKQPRA